MAYTASKLITEAYYSSSIVSREFEEIQGYQLNNGLDWLNQILADKVTDNGDLPYITTQFHFNGVPGQEKYFIANCVDIQSITFFINSVRYQMQPVGRQKYFGTPRANNISALPLSYHYERTFGGINLFVYFFPDQAYEFEVTGNFFPQNVVLNQDLTLLGNSVNLGTVTITGAGTIAANQLVINAYDLAGTYATVAALVTAINNNVDNVTATYTIGSNAQNGINFTLTNTTNNITQLPNNLISVATLGTQSSTNHVTFGNFSTLNGFKSVNYVSSGFDQFYIDYIRYELAERLCKEYAYDVPPGVKDQLDTYRMQISKLAEPMDLQIQKMNPLSEATGIDWAQVNIGKGWSVT